jgi:endonuclease/exonuclease/phosphatase family metal-dependent hydrolase
MVNIKNAAFLMMFVMLVPWADASDGIDLRVMSFNIRQAKAQDGKNHWDQRKDLVVELLQTHDPDIVGLQEALRTQLDYIRNALPGYHEVGEGHGGMTAGEYSAILYRSERFEVDESGTFWLSSTPERVSKDWGNEVFRICTWVRLIEKRSGNPC